MHALSMGPHRGPDWLGRSAMGGREPNVHSERYVVRLHEAKGGPHHARAMWLCLRLGSGGQATCEAVSFSPDPALARQASELWPLERTLLDPERSGVGIGECLLNGQSSHGLVRGGDFCISWRFQFAGGSAATPLVPAPFLYRRGWLSHKAALLALGAAIEHGELELWGALGRAAPVTKIDLTGWKVSAVHLWGSSAFAGFAALDAGHFADGVDASLSIVRFSSRVCGVRQAMPCVGALRLGSETVAFAGRQALMERTGNAPDPAGEQWAFRLRAPAGELAGQVRFPKAGHVQLSAEDAAATMLCANGELEATWTPRTGAAQTLRAERVGVQCETDPAG